jgi:hypothetical protein
MRLGPCAAGGHGFAQCAAEWGQAVFDPQRDLGVRGAFDAPRTGQYRIGGERLLPADGPVSFSYADLAVALIEEIDRPEHHRTLAAVAS